MKRSMAIVKANYTRDGGAAKAFIRYIQHRRDRDGVKITRELFGRDGSSTRLAAYELIDDAAKCTTFFRIIINPDPVREAPHKDLDLSLITEQTMQHLAERLGKAVPYVAAVHNDHAPLQHVHILALVAGRLGREDFASLRETATQAALAQRKERDQAREAAQQQQKGGGLELAR